MKIQLLIVTADGNYARHLSDTLSSKHDDTFEVGVCSSLERLNDVLAVKKYDVALIDPDRASFFEGRSVKLIFALLNEHEQSSVTELPQNTKVIRKYQRISTMISDILEQYADVATGVDGFSKDDGFVVAIWSPAGGVGKTTVALAYAARAVSEGRVVTYLDLEHFSSIGAYFSREGKSVSTLFEKLGSNPELLAKSIRQHDSGSGIDYFNSPDNYDDINELTKEDLVALCAVCVHIGDIAVIDLPSVCETNTQTIFELADIVLLVLDGSKTSEAKLDIFMSQHNVFEKISYKTTLVLNKGAKTTENRFSKVINLPPVQTGDPISVYKTLSGNNSMLQLELSK